MNRKLKKALQLLPLVGDGELTADEEKFVRDMVKQHPELTEELAKFDRIRELNLERKRVPAPPRLEEEIIRRISEEKKRPLTDFFRKFETRPRRISLEVLGAVCAAVLVFLILFRFLLTGVPTPEIAGIPTEEKNKTIDTTGTEDLLPATRDTDLIHEEPEDGILPRSLEKEIITPGEATEFEMMISDEGMSEERPAHFLATPVVPESGKGFSVAEARRAVRSPTGAAELRPTTLILISSDAEVLPVSITILSEDPFMTELDIMNRAVELGGEVHPTTFDQEKSTLRKDDKMEVLEIEEDVLNAIYLPPEMVIELLTYIEKNYPPTEHQIEELDLEDKDVLLNIDLSLPHPEE
jgi:hypothetical protein